MIRLLKDVLIAVIAAYFLMLLENTLSSNFLIPFLVSNLITILVALLAINAATLGIILTKLRDLIDQDRKITSASFDKSRKAMHRSLVEQIVLIVLAILFSIATNSMLPFLKIFHRVFEILLVSVFVYAIIVLYDTAKGVFVLLDFKVDKNSVS